MSDQTDLLEYLGRDTLPHKLLQEFVAWCVWQQAQPALVTILKRTGLNDHAENLAAVKHDYNTLATLAMTIGKHAHEARQRTGPLGLSTAEAAAFLVQKLALAATDEGFDAEGVSFFTAQVCGWAGFADAGFANPRAKGNGEQEARDAQRTHLAHLWQQYGSD